MCMSLDGYVTTRDGWPAQLADPAFDSKSYGFVEFQKECDAVLIGRTTFEPALTADRWPWPDLDVITRLRLRHASAWWARSTGETSATGVGLLRLDVMAGCKRNLYSAIVPEADILFRL
jgi:hypothetical protein